VPYIYVKEERGASTELPSLSLSSATRLRGRPQVVYYDMAEPNSRRGWELHKERSTKKLVELVFSRVVDYLRQLILRASKKKGKPTLIQFMSGKE
jgi:hypothetical protein